VPLSYRSFSDSVSPSKAVKPSAILSFSFDAEEQEKERLQRIDQVDHKKQIQELSSEFDHVIKFMDASFEKAFDKKEKDFMLAYRVRN
jgi:hypothetical protein